MYFQIFFSFCVYFEEVKWTFSEFYVDLNSWTHIKYYCVNSYIFILHEKHTQLLCIFTLFLEYPIIKNLTTLYFVNYSTCIKKLFSNNIKFYNVSKHVNHVCRNIRIFKTILISVEHFLKTCWAFCKIHIVIFNAWQIFFKNTYNLLIHVKTFPKTCWTFFKCTKTFF